MYHGYMTLIARLLNNLHPKVAATGAAGALVTLVVAVLNAYGIQMPADVQAAVMAVVAFLAGYLKPTTVQLQDTPDAPVVAPVDPPAAA